MHATVHRIIGLTLLLGALLACGVEKEARAEVSVGVNINLGPPPIVVPEPPELILVPRTQVYFVPGVDFEVFFYNGWWWSPRGERWYRSRLYNGPWHTVERRIVPGPVIRVPRDYRSVYVRERHIPYREWRERHLRREHREMMERHERQRHREMRDHREDRREHRKERREEHRERGEHGERGERGGGHER